MAICFLEVVYRLEVAVKVGPHVIPGIAGIMDILVSPGIGQGDCACGWGDVGKGVQDVGKILYGNEGRGEFATVYAPTETLGCSQLRSCEAYQLTKLVYESVKST